MIRPKLNSFKGVSLACGLAPQITDPYAMSIASIDEAVRNSICVGADPGKLAILDNFCWPSVADDETMGTLVAACEACRDAALVFGIPFISGKDSLHNQFTNSETGEVLKIPRTLLISAIGVIDDVRKCITMDLKAPRSLMVLVSATGGCGAEAIAGRASRGGRLHQQGARAQRARYFRRWPAGGRGGDVHCKQLRNELQHYQPLRHCSRKGMRRYLLEIAPDKSRAAFEILANVSTAAVVADVTEESQFTIPSPAFGESAVDLPVAELRKAWLGTLDW